ncbi:hypothetical protein ACGFYU_26645 [Streptomyces sp. NPDC048337]|uniref:allene oxide cyclase barrel-like domain-containing protein n=1 Tax=Streptomyces sp. NPDC048337 TaxID=3365535 RepID=UPI00371790DE
MRPIRAARLGTATLVALLTCAPVASATATDTGSAHAKDKARIITLQAEVKMLTRFPVKEGIVSQGDRVVVRSHLYDEANNKVGETNVDCTTTWAGDAESPEAEQCVATYVLPDGQLTVQGMYYSYLDLKAPFDNAITGGTGEYEKARGSVHAERTGRDTRIFTIKLL